MLHVFRLSSSFCAFLFLPFSPDSDPGLEASNDVRERCFRGDFSPGAGAPISPELLFSFAGGEHRSAIRGKRADAGIRGGGERRRLLQSLPSRLRTPRRRSSVRTAPPSTCPQPHSPKLVHQ